MARAHSIPQPSLSALSRQVGRDISRPLGPEAKESWWAATHGAAASPILCESFQVWALGAVAMRAVRDGLIGMHAGQRLIEYAENTRYWHHQIRSAAVAAVGFARVDSRGEQSRSGTLAREKCDLLPDRCCHRRGYQAHRSSRWHRRRRSDPAADRTRDGPLRFLAGKRRYRSHTCRQQLCERRTFATAAIPLARLPPRTGAFTLRTARRLIRVIEAEVYLCWVAPLSVNFTYTRQMEPQTDGASSVEKLPDMLRLRNLG